MNAKYRTDYFSKLSEANSPYIQLLEAKKKIFGYRYEVVRNEKSNPKNALAQPQSGTGKPSKSLSSEKAKASRTQYTKKKRSRNDPSQRMHESLCVNDLGGVMGKQTKHRHQATKSLFQNQLNPDKSTNQSDFTRLAVHAHHKSTQEKGRSSDSKSKKKKLKAVHDTPLTHTLQQLKLVQIDSLVELIENCIAEANQCISFLNEKIETLKSEVAASKKKADQAIKSQTIAIVEKDIQIDRLKKQISSYGQKEEKERAFELRKLFEIIEKMSEENCSLKKKIEQFTKERELENDKLAMKSYYCEIQHKQSPEQPQAEHKTESKKAKLGKSRAN